MVVNTAAVMIVVAIVEGEMTRREDDDSGRVDRESENRSGNHLSRSTSVPLTRMPTASRC